MIKELKDIVDVLFVFLRDTSLAKKDYERLSNALCLAMEVLEEWGDR